MRFASASALFALVSSVLAQDPNFNIINTPTAGEEVPVGKTYTIKWALGTTKGSGKVKIVLNGGKDSKTLQPKETLATGVDNTKLEYKWEVLAKHAGQPSYGISIFDEADESKWQFGQNFKITGGSDSGSNDTETSSSTTTTKASTTTSKTLSTSTTAAPTTSQPAGNGTCTKCSGGASTTAAPTPSGNSTGPVPTTSRPPTAAGIQGAAVNAAALLGGLAVAALAL